MDDQMLRSVYEALPADDGASQAILEAAKPYLGTAPVAQLVTTLVDALNAEKAKREAIERVHNQLLASFVHGDFVLRYLAQYKELLRRRALDNWLQLSKHIKRDGWHSIHTDMRAVIRHVHQRIGPDELEAERKLFSHAITFYCHRVASAHAILYTMSEQKLWRKLRENVVALENDHNTFEHPLTSQYLLRIYDRLANGIIFEKSRFTGNVRSKKTGEFITTY